MAIKTYWSILKTLVKGTKIPLIPALLADNRLVTNFLEKTNLFNIFFSQQRIIIVNNSSVPTNLTFQTENGLSTFEFSIGDIAKVIEALNPNKHTGYCGFGHIYWRNP